MEKYKRYIVPGLSLLLVVIIASVLISKFIPDIKTVIGLYATVKQKETLSNTLEQQYKKMEEFEKSKSSRIVTLKKIFSTTTVVENPESSFAIMFDDIMNMIKYNGLKLFSIKYTYNPSNNAFKNAENNNYYACQIDLQLVSDYKDFENFLTELVKYPYLIQIGEIKMIPYPKDKKILLIQLQLVLYLESANSKEAGANIEQKLPQETGNPENKEVKPEEIQPPQPKI